MISRILVDMRLIASLPSDNSGSGTLLLGSPNILDTFPDCSKLLTEQSENSFSEGAGDDLSLSTWLLVENNIFGASSIAVKCGEKFGIQSLVLITYSIRMFSRTLAFFITPYVVRPR